MKIFTALFKIVTLPVAVLEDVINPFPVLMDGEKSRTCKQVEEIDEDIKDK